LRAVAFADKERVLAPKKLKPLLNEVKVDLPHVDVFLDILLSLVDAFEHSAREVGPRESHLGWQLQI
jgi:hypothetical protein